MRKLSGKSFGFARVSEVRHIYLKFLEFSSILCDFPWLFQSVQNSLTFSWLENAFPFFQVFQSKWEPCLCRQILENSKHYIKSNGAFPLPDSDSYSDYCTDSDSMQKYSTGTNSYGDSYANRRHFASLFKKLIVVSIDPLLACLVIPTTGLYNNFHSFNK